MLTGRSPGVSSNPLVDSPYVQQDNIGMSFVPPVPPDAFLLLDGGNFELLDGDDFTLLE
jgi:hypothetical protein